MKRRSLAAIVATISALMIGAVAGFGASAAFADSNSQPASQPVLAQTGYDFTPMLITAAIFLLIAGIAVIVAKFLLARSSHS